MTRAAPACSVPAALLLAHAPPAAPTPRPRPMPPRTPPSAGDAMAPVGAARQGRGHRAAAPTRCRRGATDAAAHRTWQGRRVRPRRPNSTAPRSAAGRLRPVADPPCRTAMPVGYDPGKAGTGACPSTTPSTAIASRWRSCYVWCRARYGSGWATSSATSAASERAQRAPREPPGMPGGRWAGSWSMPRSASVANSTRPRGCIPNRGEFQARPGRVGLEELALRGTSLFGPRTATPGLLGDTRCRRSARSRTTGPFLRGRAGWTCTPAVRGRRDARAQPTSTPVRDAWIQRRNYLIQSDRCENGGPALPARGRDQPPCRWT